MDASDPRLKHGIHVRVRLVLRDGRKLPPKEGWVMDPALVRDDGLVWSERWPRDYEWAYIAHSTTFTSRESWDRETRHLRITDATHINFLDPAKVGHYWVGVAYFADMEYLDEGFSAPVKPKNRRGKHHRMRTGGLLGEAV